MFYFQVLKGVEYFRKRGLNVMVITKKHMLTGHAASYIWSQIDKISSCFVVQNQYVLHFLGSFYLAFEQLED